MPEGFPRTDPAAETDTVPGAPVRWAYSILVALPLIVLNCGWISQSEMKTGVTEITISSLFIGVTFILFILTLLNLLARRIGGGRAAMSQPELMAVYTMLSISSAVAGIGNFGFLLPFLTKAFWEASPSNGWGAAMLPLLPAVVGPRDHAILRGFYEGHSTFFRPAVMRAWAMPLTAWGLFFLLLLWTTLCLGVILRRRWAEDEHLPFPVITLPIEMTREGAPLYRNRLLWAGFALPCALHSLNSLQGLYPLLPSWPINRARDLVDGLQYPWTGLGSVTFLLHPAGVGLGYLISTDTLFSLWFFYLAKKVLNLWGTLENWRDPGGGVTGDGSAQFPFTGFQGWGAWVAFALLALWQGRDYFRRYVRRAFQGEAFGDRGEPLTARAALGGFGLGFLGLCAFVWSWGASAWLPVLFLGLYLLLMIALSRLEAETAVPSSYLLWVDPQGILTGLAGTGHLSHAELAHMSVLSWFNLDYRAAPMPHEVGGFVGLGRTGGRLPPLVGAIMLAGVVSAISALLWDLQLYYVNGAMTGRTLMYRIVMGSIPWWNLSGWLQHPKPPNPAALPGMAVGAGMTLLLTLLRTRFAGFPLSPAAYVLNASWANDLFWCDMFVAWAAKSLLLRYGGMKAYRLALPFFLGLILGDFVTGAAWSVVGVLLHLDLYRTFAN